MAGGGGQCRQCRGCSVRKTVFWKESKKDGDVSQQQPYTGGDFGKDTHVFQFEQFLGYTCPHQDPNNQIQHRSKRQNTVGICKNNNKSHAALRMLGMQIITIVGNPPPPKDPDETGVLIQRPKVLDNYRVSDTRQVWPKKWSPQKPSAIKKNPKAERIAVYTLDWRWRIYLCTRGSKVWRPNLLCKG